MDPEPPVFRFHYDISAVFLCRSPYTSHPVAVVPDFIRFTRRRDSLFERNLSAESILCQNLEEPFLRVDIQTDMAVFRIIHFPRSFDRIVQNIAKKSAAGLWFVTVMNTLRTARISSCFIHVAAFHFYRLQQLPP